MYIKLSWLLSRLDDLFLTLLLFAVSWGDYLKGFACSNYKQSNWGCLVVGRGGRVIWSYDHTNHRNKSLISADRRTKPTLMLTIPRSLFKSSTRDLSCPIFGIMIQHTQLRPLRVKLNVAILWCWGRSPIATRVTSSRVNIIVFQHGFWLRGVQS